MRVVCLALVHMQNRYGEYVLIPATNGLVPLGGSLQYGDEMLRALMALEATNLTPGELRFDIPDGKIRKVRNLFNRREGRETDIKRLLNRYLVLETSILKPRMIEELNGRFVGSRHVVARNTSDNGKTTYLIDIHNVRASRTIEQLLSQAAHPTGRSPLITFATSNEVRNARTNGGQAINPISKVVL